MTITSVLGAQKDLINLFSEQQLFIEPGQLRFTAEPEKRRGTAEIWD